MNARHIQNYSLITNQPLPAKASAVIVGSGLLAHIIALELVKLGWRDIVLLSKMAATNEVTPGLVNVLTDTPYLTDLSLQSVSFYDQLNSDDHNCWYPVGSIDIASDKASQRELIRRASWAQQHQLPNQPLDSRQLKQLIPIINEDNILEAVFYAHNGIVDTVTAIKAIQKQLLASGNVYISDQLDILEIIVRGGTLSSLFTSAGTIKPENLILADDRVAPRLLAPTGVRLPMMAAQHGYALTGTLPILAGEMREAYLPVVRAVGKRIYLRQSRDGIGLGSYDQAPLLTDLMQPNQASVKPFSPSHFVAGWRAAQNLFPILEVASLSHLASIRTTITVDGLPIVGPMQNIDGLWLALGESEAIAAGLGQEVASWLHDDVMPSDMLAFSPDRFSDPQRSQTYIWTRCLSQYGAVMTDSTTTSEEVIKQSPFAPDQAAFKPTITSQSGWGMPVWYGSNLSDQAEAIARGTNETGYDAAIMAEYQALLGNAALVDRASERRFLVEGIEATKFLQQFCQANVDRPVHTLTPTYLLNQHGTVIANATVCRLASECYWLFLPAPAGQDCWLWLKHNIVNYKAELWDVSTAQAGLGLYGPEATTVLERLLDCDLSEDAFPIQTAQFRDLAFLPIYLQRLGLRNSAAWHLYAPTEMASSMHSQLVTSLQSAAGKLAGSKAWDAFTVTLGLPQWGSELRSGYRPVQFSQPIPIDGGVKSYLGQKAPQEELVGPRRLVRLHIIDYRIPIEEHASVLVGQDTVGFVTRANNLAGIEKRLAYAYVDQPYDQLNQRVFVGPPGQQSEAIVTSAWGQLVAT